MSNNLNDELSHLIEKNLVRIPYEGDDMDVYGAADDVEELVRKLMIGFVSFVSTGFSLTPNGYECKQFPSRGILSREQIVDDYLNNITYRK